MSPVHTNALVHETSPYLLQHAHNPVEWYPWGEDAFARARTLGRPIFLSVGYSTCYWCHVMERQVFESEAIAGLMNEHFVNIKVDREERPDVDDLYMTAVQLMSRHGGWPMSVFLTPPKAGGEDDPGLLPFYAGTYFPPEPRPGMPGFPQIISTLATAWADRRAEVLEQAQSVGEALRTHFASEEEPGGISYAQLTETVSQLMSAYDPAHGGFSYAPKFPQPATLSFLLTVGDALDDGRLRAAVTHTLNEMALGGIYDHLGGGFHRYSTDARWLVPHFEKMLYDNAQLIELYLLANAWAPEADPSLYERVVRQTCEYVLRELTDPTGTFWSAQDAEVDAREGANYLWTERQVRDALSDGQLAELAVVLYGIDRGTNFQDPHDSDATPANVLYLPVPLDRVAEHRGTSVDELVAEVDRIRKRLYAVRSERPQPSTDDKVLVSWNGMMIAALARAGEALGEPLYRRAAADAATYILEHLRTAGGTLFHSMRAGEGRIDAFLEDYAFLVHGLLALDEISDDGRWLEEALALDATAKELFAVAGGGYYDTQADRPDLFVRTRSTYDGAVPSANSQMVHNQLALYGRTNDRGYLERASKDLRAFSVRLSRAGPGLTHMAHAAHELLRLAPELLEAEAGALQAVVRATLEPDDVDLSGGASTMHLTLEMDAGYHIAADATGAVRPLEVIPEGAEGLAFELHLPEPERRRYEFADAPLSVYDEKVTIEITVRSEGDGALPAAPKLVVRYQACTRRSCLAPAELVLPFSIR